MKNLIKTLFATAILAFSFNASAAVVNTMTINGTGLDCDGFYLCWDGNDTNVADEYNVNSNLDEADIGVIVGTTVAMNGTSNEAPYELDALIFDVSTSDYAYVKDGSHDPKWYIFDVSGFDVLELTGIWFGTEVGYNDDGLLEGPISHVSLYTGEGTRGLCQPDMENCGIPSVPVPAAVWLFGSGLIGLVGIARRKA